MNSKLAHIFRFLFGALVAFHLYSLYNLSPMIMGISKSLLMPALLLFYFLVHKSIPSSSLDYKIIAALFFSWLGDVFLIKGHSDPNFFMYGLIAFFAAHIFYATSFYRDLKNTAQTSLLISKPHVGLPFLIISILFLYILLPGLNDMMIPVFFYCGIITLMLLLAVNRWSKVPTSSFWLVFLGASLFYTSDAMIAINKFYQAFEYQRFFIMLTYSLGQWSIVEGILRRGR